MSKNLAQIFATNPVITIGNNDLFYTVVGGTTDGAISGQNLKAMFAPAAGSTSINMLGTVSTGTWNATLISPTYGGTGINNGSSTITIAGNITFSGAFTFQGSLTGNTNVTFPTSGTLATTSQIPSVTPAALTRTNDTNVTLTLGGTPATALLQTVSITAGWTGQLGLTRGGTNASLTASNGGIVYSTASAMGILSGTATARQMLQSGANTTPAWSTATWPESTTINRILFSSSNNVVGEITTANSSFLTTDSGGIPGFSALTTILQSANNLSDVADKALAALNLFVTRSVTAIANIPTTDYGKTIVCTGASSYSVTLTGHSAGKYVTITCQLTNFSLLTIGATSGLFGSPVPSKTSLVLGSGDSVTLYDDGTNYYITSCYIQPVNARVYLNGNQNIGATTTARIACNASTFDVGSSFDLSTNRGRAIPQWPGKYRFTAQTLLLTPTTATLNVIYIYKNGGVVANSAITTISTNNQGYFITDLENMNGSTDYLEAFFLNNAVASKNLSGASIDTYLLLERIALF